MLATYLARQGAVSSSAKSLWEQGRYLLLENSKHAQLHSLYKLVNGFRRLHVADCAASQSVKGLLSPMILFPSANGISCSSCLPTLENLVIKKSRKSSCVLSETNMIFPVSSFPAWVEFLGQHQGRQIPKSMCSRSPGLCCTINKRQRNQEEKGANMTYKCLWYCPTGKSLSSNLFGNHGIRGLSSLFYVTRSAGAAPDMPLNGSWQEEQFSNSSGSSDPKKLIDRALKLHSGACYLPHPDKEETGGEDAHFICDEIAFGLADGVGGWAEHGVDAGEYARELMSHSLCAIQKEPRGSVDPLRVLEKAYLSTRAKGSSTACIIALTDQGIHAINLGDSGFIVIRDGSTMVRSPVQQHDFNFTYQLESGNASDLPSSAQVFTFPVESGDAIVAGTDGLFDNLYKNEITAVVVHAVRAGLEPQVTAQKIAVLARQRAQDRNRQTPFSTAAQEAGYRYYGGKLDDITVIVSYIVTASGS